MRGHVIMMACLVRFSQMQSFFFLKSFGLSLISGICAETATYYAAVGLGNCRRFFSPATFRLP